MAPSTRLLRHTPVPVSQRGVFELVLGEEQGLLGGEGGSPGREKPRRGSPGRWGASWGSSPGGG